MSERTGRVSTTTAARTFVLDLLSRMRDASRPSDPDASRSRGPSEHHDWHDSTSPAPIAPLPSQGMSSDPSHPQQRNAADVMVRALGGTDVWVRGRRVERWSSRRGQMVFRYVLLQRRPVRRDVLMDLMWPHATPQSARNNLNVAIYGLRRTLEVGGPGRYVIHRDGSYMLAPDLTVWCDVNAFEALRHRAKVALSERRLADADRDLSRAAELYGGPLFADATDGEWYMDERRLLAEHFTDVLVRRARLRHETGHVDDCIELSRQVLGIEPCHESAHRLLMHSYAARGLHHLVARQYSECVQTLRRRLDVPPHPDTTSMFHQLVDSRN